jgi:CubicO group peptidase (beta-lactamase class C family)
LLDLPSGKGSQVSSISRREFGRLATEAAMLGLTGTMAACGAPSTPSRSQPTASTAPTPGQVLDSRTRPIKLTQADVDRIIGDHAHTLLEHLRSRAPGPHYGVAVAFAYPHHQFNPFYMYGTVAEKIPPTSRTIFAIGSITKTFTAALFANGVSMRPDHFDWDAGMERYLSRYLGTSGALSPTMRQITPRMLAQHTSGLARESTGPQDGVGLFLTDPSAAPPSLVDAWRTHDGPPPGSCWVYSNLGFITLGFAAVAAYGSAGQGASYAEILRDQITGPLNMPDTVTVVPDGAPVAGAHPNGRDVSSGAASDIKSSAADMHTWLLAQLGAVNGPPPLMTGLASTAQPAPLSVDICGKSTPGPANMGLAWQVEPGPPHAIWKDGLTSLGGCSCWIGFTPPGPTQEPLGIAILVNGYWNKNDPAVLADNHGPALLKQISDAI